jgi:hypothetical protein
MMCCAESRGQLIKRLEQLATDLYVALEINRIVRPARSREEALRRLCLHAREYYERAGGLPVHIYTTSTDNNRQAVDLETAPVELLKRVISLLQFAGDMVWWGREYRCRPVLTTLEHSCDECVLLRDRDYAVVARSCSLRSGCVYDFGVDVYLYDMIVGPRPP